MKLNADVFMNKRRDQIHSDTESHMRWQELGPWGVKVRLGASDENNTRLKNSQGKLIREKNCIKI